jgi:spore coat polysaccharide biosynthesis protein SpsF
MKCGILIPVRLGSQRLRAKHVQPAGAAPILMTLIRRIRHGLAKEIAMGAADIVVVSADEPENRALDAVVGREARVYYGSINNIPLRQLQAAGHFGFDQIVSVDGDDILCSPVGMLAVAELLAGGADYAQTSQLPFGMNSFGYTRSFLASALSRAADATLETGWGRIFAGHNPKVIGYPQFAPDERLRFTLDYPDDLAFFRAVIEALGAHASSASDEEIVRLVITREIFRLNAALAEEYWKNFRTQLAREQSGPA